MLMTRSAKVLMSATLALFAALVALNNLTDYGANFAFVRHVLAMDTIFPGSSARWRAIDTPLLWHAAYLLIIALELLTAALLARGAWAMWRARHASAREFTRARQWAIAGCLAGFVLWFGGFMVVGGEWFLMWQSHEWNGQSSAFRFCITLLALAIFLNQPESEPDAGA
ncbi:DUF2165 family protein [Comamonas sp. NLF-1-9]|uniref:DUF2165 family protein n=1 Tax=Comamonas sp. NLF-1-9 TaxID=2853163 RepID=UPI001C46C901|nr:DUF2165 domain-containing protein [Comamonas sp. NLF-1-9]QXL84836.1 DUF2165 domain-containing protein [Comamonas sp. NLF-1-9]